jgi:sulfatase maturation enzyme AslB (radical SAM superfamily)
MKEDTFCILPWTHFYTQVDGAVRLCCLSHWPLFNSDGGDASIRRDNPIDIWNGPDFKKIRQSMLNGESIPHCRLCYEAENNGFMSRRQFVNQEVLADGRFTLEGKLFDRLFDASDLLTAKLPIYFDLRLGNICNLRCRMCSPISSSQLEKDEVSRKWSGNSETQIVGADINEWPEAVNLLEILKTLCVDAVRIDLAGGEPTLNESQLKLLEYLIERRVANNIDLMITTNLTNTRERAFNVFSQFKSTAILLSIDGVDAVYNYIRFPGKWKNVSRNIKVLQEKYPKFYLIVFPCIQAYNILYLTELLDWCLENHLRCALNNILFLPSYLGIPVLPMEVRKLAAQKLRTWVQNNNIAEYFARAEVERIIDYLDDKSKQSSTDDVYNFIRYTKDLDRSRGQDIRMSLPEVYKSLSRSE